MTPKKNLLQKVLIVYLILQTIAGVVIAAFLYNYITDPDSEFNKNISISIKKYADNFQPLKGDRGDAGPEGADGKDGINGKDGAPGKDGIDGDDGFNGDNATAADIAAAVSQYLIANPPSAGPQGNQGDPGPRAEFRCNPDLARVEYRYPNDEDWSPTGGACQPITENPNEN